MKMLVNQYSNPDYSFNLTEYSSLSQVADLLEGPVPTWNLKCMPAATREIQTQINLPVCNALDTNGPRRVIENEVWTRKLCREWLCSIKLHLAVCIFPQSPPLTY